MTGRGGDFYDEPGVLGRYRAHRAAGVLSPNTVMEEPAFLSALGDVTGLRVLDLGCGDGALGRRVLAEGARSYLGVDGSREMVALAHGHLDGRAGRVLHDDLEDHRPRAGSVDLVVSRLALHYVEDLDTVLYRARTALVPGGRLLVTVLHPVITASRSEQGDGPRTSWLVDDYFTPGPRRRRWMGSTVTWHHRTVEGFLAALSRAGFTLDTLSECAPDASLFGEDTEELRRRGRVPLHLLLAATAG